MVKTLQIKCVYKKNGTIMVPKNRIYQYIIIYLNMLDTFPQKHLYINSSVNTNAATQSQCFDSCKCIYSFAY